MQDTSKELESANDVRETSCVVIGGGQSGEMLSLLLSRGGASVTRLDSYGDFDWSFDRDAVHPAVMQVLEEIGLGEPGREAPDGKLPSTLPTVLVVPAGHSMTRESQEPSTTESLAEEVENTTNESPESEPETDEIFALREDTGNGRIEEGGDIEESQFELGRAQGRIEMLEQELQLRERELDKLQRTPSDDRSERT